MMKGLLCRFGPGLVLVVAAQGRGKSPRSSSVGLLSSLSEEWSWYFTQLGGGRESLSLREEILALWVN